MCAKGDVWYKLGIVLLISESLHTFYFNLIIYLLGKTYTILGTDDAPGFIPRAMGHLFARLRQTSPTEIEMKLTMSYLEIYQEKVWF